MTEGSPNLPHLGQLMYASAIYKLLYEQSTLEGKQKPFVPVGADSSGAVLYREERSPEPIKPLPAPSLCVLLTHEPKKPDDELNVEFRGFEGPKMRIHIKKQPQPVFPRQSVDVTYSGNEIPVFSDIRAILRGDINGAQHRGRLIDFSCERLLKDLFCSRCTTQYPGLNLKNTPRGHTRYSIWRFSSADSESYINNLAVAIEKVTGRQPDIDKAAQHSLRVIASLEAEKKPSLLLEWIAHTNPHPRRIFNPADYRRDIVFLGKAMALLPVSYRSEWADQLCAVQADVIRLSLAGGDRATPPEMEAQFPDDHRTIMDPYDRFLGPLLKDALEEIDRREARKKKMREENTR